MNRSEILNLVAAGKMTPEEADELLARYAPRARPGGITQASDLSFTAVLTTTSRSCFSPSTRGNSKRCSCTINARMALKLMTTR